MNVIVFSIVLLLIYLSSMVAVVQLKGDTSIANFVWGGGVLLITLYTFFTMSSFLFRQILLTTLIIFWATRLILYLYMRYTGQDPRFENWKWQGTKALIINICWIFGQTFLIAVMSYPSILINNSNVGGITIFDLVGLCVWIIGFYFESVSDYQMLIFMRDPQNKGKLIRYGLWKYSRHPNYFGEITMWWGIFIIALNVPYGWTAIITPATITVMITCITGIPWVEKALEKNPEFQDYKDKTSIFFPWFSKR